MKHEAVLKYSLKDKLKNFQQNLKPLRHYEEELKIHIFSSDAAIPYLS